MKQPGSRPDTTVHSDGKMLHVGRSISYAPSKAKPSRGLPYDRLRLWLCAAHRIPGPCASTQREHGYRLFINTIVFQPCRWGTRYTELNRFGCHTKALDSDVIRIDYDPSIILVNLQSRLQVVKPSVSISPRRQRPSHRRQGAKWLALVESH
jgi:hypothetical protein